MARRASQVVVIYVALTAASSVLAYVMSVSSGHVSAMLPCFGYVGDQPPESTVFTQCFVVDAVALMSIVHIRFVQASARSEEIGAPREYLAANVAGVCVGHAAAFGLFVLACFQESHAYYVHAAGLAFYFFGSVVYFALQTVITKASTSNRRDEFFSTTRIVLSSSMFFFFILFAVGHAVSLAAFEKPWEERYRWGKEDGGWAAHLVDASAQWILILLFQLYVLTFSHEFRYVMLSKTRIVVLSAEEQSSSRPVKT